MSKKFGISSVVIVVAAMALIGFTAKPAVALKEFKEAFEAKYVKPDSTEANDVALAEAFKKVTCGTCHNGKTKKVRNEYGKELNKIITKADKNDKTKIQDAMDTVAKLKSSSGDTFGDKISGGKLPAAK
jgi:nitrate/TMAO reductase-like tetraheme cytochrome c subunit